MNWIIKADNLCKLYRLGTRATYGGTLYEKMIKQARSFLKLKKEIGIEEDTTNSAHHVVSREQTLDLPPGYFWALKDVSFEIKPGERIGLIGQNGSGKSTLLKILSRITAPSHGEFRYKGHLISLLEVGTGFHTELSGRDNIYLNAAINGMTRQQINARFKDILEFSELGEQIDTPVKRYSSGMYMRLAFAVAAHLESEILLIDEVLAVGDSGFQKKCKEKMLEVANDGRTVIFVSHDMKAIESICSKTIEMSHGQVIGSKVIVPKEEIDDAPLIDLGMPGSSSDSIEKVKLSEESNVSLCATKTWINNLMNAPGIDRSARILSCKLLNDEGVVQEKYSVNENINIEIKFEVLEKEQILNTSIYVSTADGVKLFCSMDNLAVQSTARQVGIYTQVVTIPKEFLNEGTYLISIKLDTSANQAVWIEDCLSMKVIDDCLPVGVRGDWKQSWPESLLRPRLSWSIIRPIPKKDTAELPDHLTEIINR
ncbi:MULTISPECIES: ABC transporter ATP-binding protein [unclassified Legionella]|uniref:ABC transporter ATP-binding protein n=1 Tax=unclassified Legionella TaxID=2622702 RepID=UPI001056D9BC|nr:MULTISPECIES: ABC transporter ATP-binding protein [unclassified Legionella]MDI9817749.1 ABC transporter ATP-binding protein [Legionella sp. PL877]